MLKFSRALLRRAGTSCARFEGLGKCTVSSGYLKRLLNRATTGRKDLGSLRAYSTSAPLGYPGADDDAEDGDTKAKKRKSRGRQLKDLMSTAQNRKMFTYPAMGNVKDAISLMATQGLSACIALKPDGTTSGIFTARDLIRFIHFKYPSDRRDGKEMALSARVEDLLTSNEKIIFCSPEDSLRHTREIMYQHKIRHMPIVENGEILAIITSGEVSDSSFSVESSGGKRGFMNNVMGHVGLPEGTTVSSVQNPNSGHYSDSRADRWAQEHSVGSNNDTQHLSYNKNADARYAISVAAHAKPHPFKSPETDYVAKGWRDYGARELCSDPAMSEDAHFAITVKGQHNKGDGGDLSNQLGSLVYMCVADGVGSWRNYGVDPKLFAAKLVENARKVVESDVEQREVLNSEGGWGGDTGEDSEFGGLFGSEPIHPLDVIVDAWSVTRAEKITGSCTMCVASIDNILNQLTVSNIGDCGLMVLRHNDLETLGSLGSTREKAISEDLRIAFLSQQQLRSFNLPYQLGYSGIPEHGGSFEKPSDASTFTVPVEAGDLVLLATDGLFDNLDLEEIVDHVHSWEKKWFKIGSSDSLSLSRPHPEEGKETKSLEDLATSLVDKARELSLDNKRDGPFALLAKDNDIMWSGGMPDDTTVVVARVTQPQPLVVTE